MPASDTDIAYAVSLVRSICAISGDPNLVDSVRSSFREIGLLQAIKERDNDAIFDWLVEAISYQGISDQVAAGYIERHGMVSAREIGKGLERRGLCPKLGAYWLYEGCGYKKGAGCCKQPSHYRRCPLPRHDLRNGNLNQASYSLYLFMRDLAGGDLVGWIDQKLEAVTSGTGASSQDLRDAVVGPLLHIHGVSHKVLHMTLANLLLADGRRKRWMLAGCAMVAVDTLVHNWLWRTGITKRLGVHHPYGPACYREHGCEWVINRIAREIDAREFNPRFPAEFPRFVQKAIWSYCAGSGHDQCNGNRVDDRKRCANTGDVEASRSVVQLKPARQQRGRLE